MKEDETMKALLKIQTKTIDINKASMAGVTEDGMMVDVLFNGCRLILYNAETGEKIDTRWTTWKITWVELDGE